MRIIELLNAYFAWTHKSPLLTNHNDCGIHIVAAFREILKMDLDTIDAADFSTIYDANDVESTMRSLIRRYIENLIDWDRHSVNDIPSV